MGPAEMHQIAGWICEVLRHPDDSALRARIAEDVRSLCVRFPIWGQLDWEQHWPSQKQ
jgi:glycine/serine hydroxymethyltransferase